MGPRSADVKVLGSLVKGAKVEVLVFILYPASIFSPSDLTWIPIPSASRAKHMASERQRACFAVGRTRCCFRFQIVAVVVVVVVLVLVLY